MGCVASDVRSKQPGDKDIRIRTRKNEFAQTHPDELLNAEEFKRVIKDWNRNMTIDEACEFYQNTCFSLPGATVPIDEPRRYIETLRFKDKHKYKFGTKL